MDHQVTLAVCSHCAFFCVGMCSSGGMALVQPVNNNFKLAIAHSWHAYNWHNHHRLNPWYALMLHRFNRCWRSLPPLLCSTHVIAPMPCFDRSSVQPVLKTRLLAAWHALQVIARQLHRCPSTHRQFNRCYCILQSTSKECCLMHRCLIIG